MCAESAVTEQRFCDVRYFHWLMLRYYQTRPSLTLQRGSSRCNKYALDANQSDPTVHFCDQYEHLH